jgi:hypothetical protein
MFKDYPGEIYAARKDSPMIIGVSGQETFLASDVTAMLNHTRRVYYIGNLQAARLKPGEVHFYDPQDFCFPEKTPTIYTEEYQQVSRSVIKRVADYFDKIYIPVIIGEIAAFDKNNTLERVKFSELVASESKKRGIVLIWWMGLLDRQKCKWSEPEVVDALFNGLK